MSVKTIPTNLSLDVLEKMEFGKKSATNVIDLQDDTKYALCLLKLNSVITPADYPALGAAISAVTGIVEINLVIDHQTEAEVQTNHTQIAVIRAKIQLRDDTPMEP